MNIFVYDVFLDKYKRKIKKTEEKLNSLSLQGKIIYLKNIKNLTESLKYEINNGAKTIVSVGNDETVSKLINVLPNISEKIPLSIIPIGPKNSIAPSLGILNEKEACYVLSARRKEVINIGIAGESLFISNVSVESQGSYFYIDKSFKLFPQKRGVSYVFNLSTKENELKPFKISPQDKTLSLYIKDKTKTHVPLKTIDIKGENKNIIIDNAIEVKGPLSVSVSEKKITFIVGKERSF
jgi:diacylglycerol kinase family enzyme